MLLVLGSTRPANKPLAGARTPASAHTAHTPCPHTRPSLAGDSYWVTRVIFYPPLQQGSAFGAGAAARAGCRRGEGAARRRPRSPLSERRSF